MKSQSMRPREDVVGLYLGDDTIAAARVQTVRGGRLRLIDAGVADCAPDAGEEQIASAIKRLWRTCRIGSFTVSSALPCSCVVLKHFAFPRLSPEELRSALQLEAEEVLQQSQDEVAVDWHINRTAETARNGNSIEGIMVAARRRGVDRHLRVLARAGLLPIVVDVTCMAVANLYLQTRGRLSPDEVVGLVHLGARSADISILSGGAEIYPRAVVSQSGTWRESRGYLVNNISDEMRYYQFKLKLPPVQRLVITGRVPFEQHELEGARDEALIGDLRRVTGLPLQFWNPIADDSIDVPRRLRKLFEDEDQALRLVPSLGLALRRN